LPYVDGCLPVPEAPGIGVQLDEERVARYAELYRREGASLSFDDPAATAETPVIPKL
jgi:galactonate dehydratase/glucarate dehydratase